MRTSITASVGKSIVESGKTRTASFNLVDFTMASDSEIALVTLAYPNTLKYDFADLAKSFNSRFEERVVLVEESFNKIGSRNGQDFAVAIARMNTISKEYNVTEMACVASGTFLDEDENTIWRSVGTGNNKRLILQSSDDFSELLASRRRHMSVPETANVSDIQNGQYVMYYSPIHDEMNFGFGFRTEAGLKIFNRETEELEDVDPIAVVETAAIHDSERRLDFSNETANVKSENISKILDYFRKLYKGTSYFKNLEKSIRSHRG